ncbi:MAG: hypothetical protein H7Z17_17490, partial [Fuerstia sp.]|nr:hypothetical protein [Fuerstiella sp.]
PAFAGKKATCQKCGCRLLISADFSEIRQLELEAVRNAAEATVSNSPSTATSPAEFDLVLGQNVFGWKLSRKWALGLAGLLMLVLLLMTMFFTNKASQAEQDRLRQQFRSRSTERG